MEIKRQRRKGRKLPAPPKPPAPPVSWRITSGGPIGNAMMIRQDQELSVELPKLLEAVQTKRIDWFRVTRLDP